MAVILYDATPTGVLYRSLAALLVALDEGDSVGIDAAMETTRHGWLMRKQAEPKITW